MSTPDFAPPPITWVGPGYGAADQPGGDHGFGESPRRSVGGQLVRALLVTVAVASTGLLVGWLWAHVAPRIAVIKVDGGFVYADAEPEQAIAGDGWFALLGLAAGVIFAVATWVLLRRHRGTAVLVGLVLGSVLAALLAWWIGYRIGSQAFHHSADSAAIGARLKAPLMLRLADVDPKAWWRSRPTGVAAVQALAAALVYTCLAGFSADPQLRPKSRGDHEPTGPDTPPGTDTTSIMSSGA